MAAPSHLMTPDISKWSFAATGPYEGRYDLRELYQISHPWVISQSGSLGALTGKLTVPANWRGPIKLRYFYGDNYRGMVFDKASEINWFSDIVFVGHRFRQLLIDGNVVWEEDVVTPIGTGKHYVLDLSQWVRPGQSFEVTLRLYDKVASDQELPGDYHHVNDGDTRKDDPAVYHRFETRSYWGDVALYDASVSDAQADKATSWDFLRGAKPLNAGEAADRGKPATGPIHLTLETQPGVGLPACGYPVRTGVPFAQGMLKPGQPVELQDNLGKSVPVQTTVLTKWNDGSIKWLLLDFTALPDNAQGRYKVIWLHASPAKCDKPVSVRKTDEGITVDSGPARFTVPGGAGRELLAGLGGSGGKSVGAITGVLDCRIAAVDGTLTGPTVRYFATREQATVESSGPIRVTVRIDGRLLDDRGNSLGKMVMRVEAVAGLPFVKVSYRVFNGSAEQQRLDLSRLTLQSTSGQTWAAQPDVTITEAKADLPGADGIRVQEGFGVAVRHFWQQFPKAISTEGASLNLDLYHPMEPDARSKQYNWGEVNNWFACGEAKTHELMLSFSPNAADTRQALATFDTPPRLFDKQWHCQSGGWGPAMWRGPSQFSVQHEQMGTYSSHVSATTSSNEFGLRNFGDWRYGSLEADTWFDNYYDPLHSQFMEYLMGGGQDWFQRSEVMCRHNMDLDIIHENLAHPELTGGIKGYTVAHHDVDGYVHSYCLSPKGYLDYYHMTGDPDALQTAKGLAEYVIRAGTGMGSRSVREQAWPLTVLLATYRETHDPNVLAGAKKLFEDTLLALDPRRGCYSEPHGSFTYPGDIPWMCGQMVEDHMMYYWETGDRRAAQRAVGLASALYCENMGGPGVLPLGYPDATPGRLGVFTYSPNPYLANWSSNYVFLTDTSLAYAWDLTGRKEFIEAAAAGYQACGADRGFGFGTYWQAPILLYYLKLNGGDATK